MAVLVVGKCQFYGRLFRALCRVRPVVYQRTELFNICVFYSSVSADDEESVDLGGGSIV